MITLKRFRRIERALAAAGYGDDNDWAERLRQPSDADAFARAAVYVVVNSGMSYTVAGSIYRRCLKALWFKGDVRRVFRHKGKAKAINRIWADRAQLFAAYLEARDKLGFCQSLPWIGPTTCYHLAKDLGVDVAKPDVHLARLAARDRISVQGLCRRLARQAGYRVATVDTILWRACATGIIDSKVYQAQGWRAAFRETPKLEH